MRYKFEIVIKGIKIPNNPFYRQTTQSGMEHAEKRIREVQSDFGGHFNKEAILYVFEREENGKYGWIDTQRFEPIKN